MNRSGPGRPPSDSADFIPRTVRMPAEMLARVRAQAAAARRPLNWEFLMLLEEALTQRDVDEQEDPETVKALRRKYASV